MSLIENDPRKIAYIALFTAIVWYQELTPEAALDIVRGQSRRKPGQRLTIGMFARMKKVIDSPNFYNINTLVKKYRVNKYEIFEALSGDKNANEEVIAVIQTEKHLKKLKEFAENCTAVDCSKCPLDILMSGDLTLCEILMEAEIDDNERLQIDVNRAVQKSAKKCNYQLLNGETKKRGFEIYESVNDEFNKYMENHKDKKIRDVASAALLDYMRRHK